MVYGFVLHIAIGYYLFPYSDLWLIGKVGFDMNRIRSTMPLVRLARGGLILTLAELYHKIKNPHDLPPPKGRKEPGFFPILSRRYNDISQDGTLI